jgi:hypothetical protein
VDGTCSTPTLFSEGKYAMVSMNTFDEVVESTYYNKRIRLKCIVVGKTLAPYQVPKVVTARCNGKRCVCKFKKEKQYPIPVIDQRVLMFIDAKTRSVPAIVGEIIGSTCRNLEVRVDEVQLIERIFIARPTGNERTRKGGGSRAAYVIADSVETNSIYDMQGYSTVDPLTQKTTHVFTTAKRTNSDVEAFEINEYHNALTQFQVPESYDAVEMYKHLCAIYQGYSANFTKIYERDDLHLAVDMSFRSVISFWFDGEHISKGWLDVMLMGDTRCGKGFVAERMVKFFGVGEVVNGESATIAGLIGGVQRIDNQWAITWGKIPMNDCGYLMIDESTGLDTGIWGQLSRVRSEGVAEITKIVTEVANARARLLWVCNPHNRMINTYSYGIQSVLDIVKAPEDIARFDYILVVAHNEVEGKYINKHRPKPAKLLYDEKAERELIMWCWSRKEDEVIFTDEAVSAIYEMSLRLAAAYDYSIPLIQVENIRYKIAKISIAFAARFYSNEENGKYLVVKTVHVECAWIFFDVMYKKESSGYLAYSQMKKSAMEIATPEKLAEIQKYFDGWLMQKSELMRCLLINNYISDQEVSTHMGVDQRIGKEVISKLLKTGCLQRKGQSYIKSPEFTHYLKKVLLTGSK